MVTGDASERSVLQRDSEYRPTSRLQVERQRFKASAAAREAGPLTGETSLRTIPSRPFRRASAPIASLSEYLATVDPSFECFSDDPVIPAGPQRLEPTAGRPAH